MTTTIGALTNVPAPGDPIRSPWAQDVTKLGVHVFASKAALDAQWTAPPVGAHAYTTDTRTEWVRTAAGWVVNGPHEIAALTDSALRAGYGTALTTIPNTTFTYTFSTTRRYRFGCRILFNATAANTGFIAAVLNTVGPIEVTRIDQDNAWPPSGVASAFRLAHGEARWSPATTGALTLALAVATRTGLIDVAGGTISTLFWCDDIGPNPVVP